jgi:tetratricopeptide (TPR) repeat protein
VLNQEVQTGFIGARTDIGLIAARHYWRQSEILKFSNHSRLSGKEPSMERTLTGIAIVLAAGLLAATPTVAQQPAQQSGGLVTHQPKLSSDAAKAIIDLQSAVTKNDVASIPAKVAAAKAAAKTADDKYAIGIMELKAANARKDQAGIAAALEDMLSSGSVQPNEQLGLYQALAQTYSNANQPQRAVAAYQHVLQLQPNNVDAVGGLAEAQIAAGQAAAAVPTLQQGIKLQQASGQKAPEAWYKRATSVAYQAKLPAASELAREWVAAYPTPTNWSDAIAIYRNLSQPDVEGTLDLLRLESAVGALKTPGEYALYAESAADQLNYNEAQAVIDAGIAAHVVDPSSATFRDIVSGLKGKQKASAADLEAAAKMSPSPTNLLRIGDRYYGMGNYSKAADIYRQVLSKPGADRDLANLHLGMALARAGDKAGATAALNAVTGARSDIAKYWLVYAQQHA